MGWKVSKKILIFVLCSFAALTFMRLFNTIKKKIEGRTFTVQGISERRVGPNSIKWKLVITLSSDDISSAMEKLENLKVKFLEFCKDQKIKKDECSQFEVTIKHSEDVEKEKFFFVKDKEARYSVSASVVVESKDVNRILDARYKIRDNIIPLCLYRDYLVLSYARSSALRNEMSQEAFRNAQKIAEKIAEGACVKVENFELEFDFWSCTSRSIDEVCDEPIHQIRKVRVISNVVFSVQ
ncbi:MULTISPECIES: SIMPL domain-containing protein [Holospora]|uniref:Oxidative stress defense protein n=2 Tax=Holospora TaxID=44747 RepID=A0A061JIT2_9PROT|nr:MULTISPECIES: SIMPL domain-containing protein [Holospora]ETZ05109.1 hypothetical protein K737_300460 [Holospora undulata HU1]GAJ46212.1 hypothetical protein HE1_00538 [Holospora elegans E1]